MGLIGISFVPGYDVLFTMTMLIIVAGSACFAALYMFVEILCVLCKHGLYFDPYSKYIPKYQGYGSGGSSGVVHLERMYR
jgi:hypothetical protein